MIVASYRNTQRSIEECYSAAIEAKLPAILEEARQTAIEIIAKAHQRADEIICQAQGFAEAIMAGNPELPRRRISIDELVQIVADRTGVPISQIKGHSRFKSIVAARFEAIAKVYVVRPDLSLVQIGRYFNRDHSTILHAVKESGVWRSPGGGHQPRWGAA